MDNVNLSRTPDMRPCYRIDRETGEWIKEYYDWNELLEKYAAHQEAEKKFTSDMWVLSETDLQSLADRYDPHNMTEEEYKQFLDELVEKRVISTHQRMSILHPEMITIAPTAMSTVSVRTLKPGEDGSPKPTPTLEEYNGNFRAWLKALAAWVRDGWPQDTTKAAACDRICSVLDEMQARRPEEVPEAPRKNLTRDEIRELAGQYDPEHMSWEEYSQFLNRLADQGVLSRSEHLELDPSIVPLDNTSALVDKARLLFHSPDSGLQPLGSGAPTLEEYQGNVLEWLKKVAEWRENEGKELAKTDAYLEFSRILLEMKAQRTPEAEI